MHIYTHTCLCIFISASLQYLHLFIYDSIDNMTLMSRNCHIHSSCSIIKCPKTQPENTFRLGEEKISDASMWNWD